MKKFLFLILVASPLQAKTIPLVIPDDDIKIVESDVLDAEQWIKEAWAGKLARSKERLIKKEIERSVRSGETVPAGETAIIHKAFTRPDYETRKQRDAREERERQER